MSNIVSCLRYFTAGLHHQRFKKPLQIPPFAYSHYTSTQWNPLIMASPEKFKYGTVDSAFSGHLGTGLKWPQYPMALISSGILVLMWILGHDFSGHYNRLALISVDIINGVYNRKENLAYIWCLKIFLTSNGYQVKSC